MNEWIYLFIYLLTFLIVTCQLCYSVVTVILFMHIDQLFLLDFNV